MTAGAWIHDELGAHIRACVQCKDTNAEQKRVERDPHAFQAARSAMCRLGRSIYDRYLIWLKD